jgi:hypothetical protein
MVIEYKIKFEDGGVTVTQNVTRTADDGGGSGPQAPPGGHGGSGPQAPPGGKGGGVPNGVIGVILGPLVIGGAGSSDSREVLPPGGVPVLPLGGPRP